MFVVDAWTLIVINVVLESMDEQMELEPKMKKHPILPFEFLIQRRSVT